MDDDRPPPPGWYPHPGGGQRYWDGDVWTDAPAAPDGDSKKPDKLAAGCGLGCGGLFLVVGLIWVLSAVFGGDDSPDDGGGEYGARDVCQQFMEDRLKSPGSADFSDEAAIENADGSWTVRGTVDSDNSFGASVRNQYVCQVRYASGDNWKLINLQTTGN